MSDAGKRIQVLVVDDELLIRYGISKLLMNVAEVETVSSAEEALDQLAEKSYDVCFLDVILPGMNGLEAMKIMKKSYPNIKIVIMTGGYLDEDIKDTIQQKAFAFIEKPFQFSSISRIVDTVAAELTNFES